ncbi:unnamed protein product [Linum tenue]|uniref:BZIP domain-containing protein n=1 Tax=Linum tenue TaxID=586396 RepID=A0AAV0GNQ0_9ROSI|nr:unnamed protein product [Linum tenue]
MADSVLEPHLPPPPISDADSLLAPPLDPLFFSSSSTNPDQHGFIPSDLPSFNFDDDFDLDFDFDGFTDPLYFPPVTESFPLPESGGTIAPEADGSPESGNSVVSGGEGGGCSDVGKYFNRSPSRAGSCDSDEGSTASGAAAAVGIANCTAASPASSHGSGSGGKSDVSETMDASSPDPGTFPVKDEEANAKKKRKSGGSGALPKRKKDASHDASARRQKCRVSEIPKSNSSSQGSDTKTEECGSFGPFGEEDEKKKARLMRNRESAQLSRQRKKHYVEELEDKVRAMHSAIADLNGRVSYFMAENASLRQQLGGGNGLCPPPMYPPPMAPMPYPWMPCPPYMVKPQGSQVPLVPIPRLKPQQPAASAKSKKGETTTKKSETKTKKVASVSFLGLLFFILMFGGLLPVINVKYGGPGENVAGRSGDSFSDQHFRGRVLVVDGHSNRSSDNSLNRVHCEKSKSGGAEHIPKPSGFAYPDNSSEQLHASLYVPRNDKLVKIDGNLIIHSILASERTTTGSQEKKTTESKPKETGLAIPKDFSGALAIPDGNNRGRFYRTSAEQQKAIGSRSADNLKEQFKSSAADGKLQQWFHQGLAGPMLSSGICSEVFQFDVSPSPGAIVSSPPLTNLTREPHQNATPPSDKKKHRRILHGLPVVPFPGSDLNVTGEHKGRKNETFNIQGNNSKAPASSMVVSVLLDPREIADTEVDGVYVPKSLSRVFVVVLVDSVKYVTYSCMLPRSSPHLVRA